MQYKSKSQLSKESQRRLEKKYGSGVWARRAAYNRTSKATRDRLRTEGISKDDFLRATSTSAARTYAQFRRVTDHLLSINPAASRARIEENVLKMSAAELNKFERISRADYSRLARVDKAKVDAGQMSEQESLVFYH